MTALRSSIGSKFHIQRLELVRTVMRFHSLHGRRAKNKGRESAGARHVVAHANADCSRIRGGKLYAPDRSH